MTHYAEHDPRHRRQGGPDGLTIIMALAIGCVLGFVFMGLLIICWANGL